MRCKEARTVYHAFENAPKQSRYTVAKAGQMPPEPTGAALAGARAFPGKWQMPAAKTLIPLIWASWILWPPVWLANLAARAYIPRREVGAGRRLANPVRSGRKQP